MPATMTATPNGLLIEFFSLPLSSPNWRAKLERDLVSDSGGMGSSYENSWLVASTLPLSTIVIASAIRPLTATAAVKHTRVYIENIPGRLPENSRRWFPIGIERKENINKNWFLYKNIFKCNLFWCHFVIEHTPVSQWEATGSSINTNKHYR